MDWDGRKATCGKGRYICIHLCVSIHALRIKRDYSFTYMEHDSELKSNIKSSLLLTRDKWRT